jgi:hypothetical protein
MPPKQSKGILLALIKQDQNSVVNHSMLKTQLDNIEQQHITENAKDN